MPNVYFISDLHIYHTNLNNNLRKMSNEDHWNLLKKNWNNKVKSPKDTVYILGDLTMDKPEYLHYLNELNGIKILIGGNHDTKRICNLFNGSVVMGCCEYKGYILSHIPVHKTETKRRRGNIHGHIHKYHLPNFKYINVCSDLNNYTPLTLDEIIKKQKEKKKFCNKIKLIIRFIKHEFL